MLVYNNEYALLRCINRPNHSQMLAPQTVSVEIDVVHKPKALSISRKNILFQWLDGLVCDSSLVSRKKDSMFVEI